MADTPQPAPGAAELDQLPPLTALIPQQSAQDILGGVQAGAQAAPQPQPVATPDATGTIPLQPTTGTVPTNESQSLFHRAMYDMKGVLAKVADILGPSEVAKVTQDPQTGDFTVSKQPATTGEKWGRIASAALGGLASSLQNAQGPGGVARAAGAGIQTGMQQPQQQLQQAQQEASYQQQQLLAKANRIHLTQTNYLLTQELANAKLEYDSKTAGMLQGIMDEYANNPGAKELAVIDPSDPNSVVRAGNSVPGLMDSFLQKNNKQITPIPGPDHMIHLFQTDMAWGKQRNNVPRPYYYIGQDDNGDTTILKRTVPVGGDTNEHIDSSNLATFNAAATLRLNSAKADAAETAANKPAPQPKSIQEAQSAASAATDPKEKARLTQLANDMTQTEIRLRQAGRNVNAAPPAQESLDNWATLLANPRSGVTLAAVKPANRDAVINNMAQKGLQIAKPLTAQELNRSDLAGNAISNIEAAQRILERRPDMFGPAGFGKTAFQKLVEGGDPDAMDYLTDIQLANLPAVGIHGVRGKWALEDLSKLDSNLYLNQDSMRNVLNDIHRSASEFGDMGGRRTGGPAAPSPAGGTTTPPNTRAVTPSPQPALPQSLPGVPVRTDNKGNYKQLQGNKWVDVAPPPQR